MGSVVGTTGHGLAIPIVIKFEDQGCVDTDGRMKAVCGLPGAIANAPHIFTGNTCGVKGYKQPVAKDVVPRADKPRYLHLLTLEGGIHVPNGCSAGVLFLENVPRLKGPAKLNSGSSIVDFSDAAENEIQNEARTMASGTDIPPH